MRSADESQLWCRGPSLWSQISDHVPEAELSKIRAALGHHLVDMYTEVHAEVEIWYKVWQGSQQSGNHGCRAGTPLPRRQGSPLPDPPAVKELVRAEVKMLLQMLRERAGREGRDKQELLTQYKPETVDYALGHLDRRSSSCLSPGDSDSGSRPSSCCSVQSSAGDEIEAMRDKLNVTDIEQVVDRLRSMLMEECEVLNRLVQDLKKNIKRKYRSKNDDSEPSLSELRKLRAQIQMDLELYPTSFGTSSPASSFPAVKELKTRFRRSTERKHSDETLQGFSSASVPAPHPPPRCQPRPPAGPPPTKISVSRTHGHALTSNVSSRPPICPKLTSSSHVNSHFNTDVITIKSDHLQCPWQHSAGAHEAQLSSHGSLSREDDLPQSERKEISRNISVPPSHNPALSPVSDAGSCLTAHSSSHSAGNYEQRQIKAAIQPASVQLEGKVFTFAKTPFGGVTSQPVSVQDSQTEPAVINRLYQPVPPSRVST